LTIALAMPDPIEQPDEHGAAVSFIREAKHLHWQPKGLPPCAAIESVIVTGPFNKHRPPPARIGKQSTSTSLASSSERAPIAAD
jgi:hypothetical protein